MHLSASYPIRALHNALWIPATQSACSALSPPLYPVSYFLLCSFCPPTVSIGPSPRPHSNDLVVRVLLVLIMTLLIERTVIRNIVHTIILTLQSVFYDWLVTCSVFFLDALSYAKFTLAYRVTI